MLNNEYGTKGGYQMSSRDLHPGLGEKHENIVLDYPVRIERHSVADGGVETTVYFATSAEFFLDEHGIQWIKFVARNGYAIGKEHFMRTDVNGFLVVRDEDIPS